MGRAGKVRVLLLGLFSAGNSIADLLLAKAWSKGGACAPRQVCDQTQKQCQCNKKGSSRMGVLVLVPKDPCTATLGACVGRKLGTRFNFPAPPPSPYPIILSVGD
jgi:hypothetical protein